MRIKALQQKNLVKAKKIIVDSIKDHLIPKISSPKTPKEMFDSLTKLFEGKNINQNITLRKQLKNVKIQNAETIQSYLYKGFSNQRTTCNSRRRSGECRSGYSHLEWPPMLMGFIHVRNVCQKEVITFRKTLGRTHIRRGVLVLEGDEAKSLTPEELGQGQEDHC